ncbi:hypothetical protein A3860_13440 [Niastella vici]|uniref:Sulfatase N-terminal domain-containing protein n=1 Tax=Niastella vici TaxID=1703345 RepID=A0A1V9G7N6_9BACT|nr:sulfatase-like hydrolase/transferase [Niastella vici]OQP66488.1 hypothetical protein A3860_13440 [Niastella vici]
MFSKLGQYSLYPVLLPVFFVLHGCLENYGFISPGEGLLLAIIYTAGALVLGGTGWMLFRNIPKAALFAFMLMAVYFFFGAIHDFLKEHAGSFFSSYVVLLSAFLILLIVVIVYLKKRNSPFKRLTAFLNLLFIVYILIGAGDLIAKTFRHSDYALSVYPFAKNNTARARYKQCPDCHKPDIYFLLMDGYASTVALAKWYQYQNNLDSFLLRKKFSIQANSRSNYNFTPFSMASILNMSYLQGIANPKNVTVNEYANCEVLIRNNEVINRLSAAGYDIVNYSVFNLAGHPSVARQDFLPLNTRLITERTLFACIRKDIGWKLAKWYPFKWFWSSDIMQDNRNNQSFIELVKTSAATKSAKPRFVYGHFFMPHSPYYYDKNGQLKDIATITTESLSNPIPAYLEYVTYVNGRIREMITAIQQQNPSAVIILMGDHGNRDVTSEAFPVRYFQNLNAVYYPDNDYKLLYDSISGVNQFRVVLNKLLKQDLPLLPDSSIYLLDKGTAPHMK